MPKATFLKLRNKIERVLSRASSIARRPWKPRQSNLILSNSDLVRYAMKAHWRAIDLIEQERGIYHPRECVLCGHMEDDIKFEQLTSQCIFQGGRLVRYKCPACDVIFGPTKMLALDDEMLQLEYSLLYSVYSEGDTTSSTIRAFHLLNPTPNGVYLDYGCGGGWSEAINQLRMDGWNIYGFEPSASSDSPFVFSRLDQIQGMQFDGILTHNVLEHLVDPIGVTRNLANMLTNDGCIVHATACFDYLYEVSRFHLFFFTGRSPEMLAKKSSMFIERWVRDGEFIACILRKENHYNLGQ